MVKSVSRTHSREGDKREKLYAKGVAEARGGESFATWVQEEDEEEEEEMPSCAATKPRMQDMEDGPCCVARRRGKMAVRGNVCFSPTCLLLKTGAWHRHFKWMKVTVRVT